MIGGIMEFHHVMWYMLNSWYGCIYCSCSYLSNIDLPQRYFCQSIFLYLSDAQFLLDQRLRKVVPVMYQRCQLPPELTYYYWLDYARSGKLYDFWTKLHNSIQSASSTQPARYLKHYKWSDQHISEFLFNTFLMLIFCRHKSVANKLTHYRDIILNVVLYFSR